MLSFLASIILTTVLSIDLIPKTMHEFELFATNLKESFPKDLIVNFKDGSWDVNKEEPVIIPMPVVELEEFKTFSKNLVVFDKNGTIDQIKELDSLILFNKENAIFRNENEEIISQPLANVPDFTLDEKVVNEGFDKIFNKILKYLPFIVPAGTLLFVFLFNYLGGVFLVAFIVGLILLVVSIFLKEKISFTSACKISLHSITIPIILQLFSSAFPNMNLLTPSRFFLLSFLTAVFFLYKMGEDLDLKKIEKD